MSAVPVRNDDVLVVDDELMVRRTLVRVITKAGYQCSAVSDASEALGHFAQGARPRLVISDLNLPGASGLELAHRIAEVAPGTPVLITSGSAPQGLLDDPLVAGFVEKPFEAATLTDAIAEKLPTT
jgi:CheY-like chemotaxis protein